MYLNRCRHQMPDAWCTRSWPDPRIHRGLTEGSQRIHRGLSEAPQATHGGLAEDLQRTHRGLAEDSQRTRRGLAEDSQKTHRRLTEDSQTTCRGLTEGSFWELVIQGLGDFYHQPRIAKLQFGMAPYNRNMGMEVSERQTYDLAFEYDSIKMLLQRMLKYNLKMCFNVYIISY